MEDIAPCPLVQGVKSPAMPQLDRRTLLCAFGVASVTTILPARTETIGEVALAAPGENRFAFSTDVQAKATPCKVTSADSQGSCTIFEMNALPRSGPFLHVHHREDEWYYVLSGEFIFKAGGVDHNLTTGASIWLPRGTPHVWANTATTNGKLILLCQPGGFEHFFDEIGKVPMEQKNTETMRQLMAKYGMDLLGPPIFTSSWVQQH